MNTKHKQLISLGILLGLTIFIALGAATFHMFNSPSNVSAAQVEESSDKDSNTVIADMSEPSSISESSTQESVDSNEEPVIVEEVAKQEETPVIVEEVAKQEETPVIVEKVAKQKVSPMTINILDRVINYQNGGVEYGQAIIDANRNNVSTWGGSPIQSGNDGLNTHFIGHNPGIFDILFSVTVGTTITITDGDGIATTYTVQNIFKVDDYGYEVGTGTDYLDFITGSGGGERVTFQTCIDDLTNLIIVAYP